MLNGLRVRERHPPRLGDNNPPRTGGTRPRYFLGVKWSQVQIVMSRVIGYR